MTEIPMPKDPATAAVEKGIEEAAATARHYLDKLLGSSLEQGGGIISDTVGYWRFKNKINLVLKAKRFLEDKGIDPKAVLPKVVVPILEAGSLETDEDMKTRWAVLLANAASPEWDNRILPGYTDILRQLTPLQARILDWIWNNVGDHVRDELIIKEFGLTPEDYDLLASDLHRLQLIDGRRQVTEPYEAGALVDENINYASGVPRWTTASNYFIIGLTPLGVEFLRACRPTTK